MKNLFAINKRWVYTIVIILVIIFTFGFTKDNKNFELSKGLNIYHNVFRELNLAYVDEIDYEKLIKASIEHMLKKLDPYTVYIPESEADNFKTLTTGEYAGIGAVISKQGKYIIIVAPYKDFPADKYGLKAGDKILEVDGKNVVNESASTVSKLLKGRAETIVNVKIERPFATNNPQVINITREGIQLKCVPHYGMVDENIGYILFANFNNKAEKDVKYALLDLKSQGATSIILDVRGNPGGLLNQAVQVTNLFLDKGTRIVSTKGKRARWEHDYNAKNFPVDKEIPLVVLVNKNSASASEILAGAIQDLDRGVVIGQRTYGKGLVQQTRPLSYDAQLKVTTAHYYIPSGRSIQAIDYSNRNEDGSLGQVPDSLISEFTTKNGRKVYDGGGILPDIVIEHETLSKLTSQLINKYVIFNFATQYAANHDNIDLPDKFMISDSDYEEFKELIRKENITYNSESFKIFNTLKETLEKENLLEKSQNELDALEKILKPELNEDLNIFENEIKDLISAEITERYYYQEGGIINTLQNDKILKKAIEVLKDKSQYSGILSGEIVANNSKE